MMNKTAFANCDLCNKEYNWKYPEKVQVDIDFYYNDENKTICLCYDCTKKVIDNLKTIKDDIVEKICNF